MLHPRKVIPGSFYRKIGIYKKWCRLQTSNLFCLIRPTKHDLRGSVIYGLSLRLALQVVTTQKTDVNRPVKSWMDSWSLLVLTAAFLATVGLSQPLKSAQDEEVTTPPPEGEEPTSTPGGEEGKLLQDFTKTHQGVLYIIIEIFLLASLLSSWNGWVWW